MSIIDKISNCFKKNITNPEKESSAFKAYEYVGKFVNQGGAQIGESIAVENDRIIVKNSDGMMSIPLGAVITNTENIVVGDFNREESLQLGKEWFDRKDTLKFDEKGMLIK